MPDSLLNAKFKAFGAIFNGPFWSENLKGSSSLIALQNLTFFICALQSHKWLTPNDGLKTLLFGIYLSQTELWQNICYSKVVCDIIWPWQDLFFPLDASNESNISFKLSWWSGRFSYCSKWSGRFCWPLLLWEKSGAWNCALPDFPFLFRRVEIKKRKQ